jgi:predicted chitinase
LGAGADDPTFDLIANPDNMLDPDMSAAFAACYFRDHGGDGACLIPMAARRGDWAEVRRLVQGGDAGLPELIAIADEANNVPA